MYSKDRTIAGTIMMPFYTAGYEGFDINYPYDWKIAEELISTGQAILPSINELPYI